MRLVVYASIIAPVVLVGLALRAAGADPVTGAAAIVLSATINALWPLGGGMVVEGTCRVRIARAEWTLDVRRSRWESAVAAAILPAATIAPFLMWAPLLAFARGTLISTPPFVRFDEAIALGAVVLMLVVARARHRPELPLKDWRARVAAVDRATRRAWVAALAGIAQPDGAIGHVGGIGAFTVGLHECLDAEEILRGALAEAEDARPLHDALTRYIAAQRGPDGGFAVYPGGDPRASMTTRANAALAPPPPLA